MVTLLRRKLQKHYGNDAIGTSILIYTPFCAYMESPSGTSSFVLIAVNAMLEDSLFKMRSEVAAHSHKAAESLRVWCENKTNEEPYTKFSCLLLKELEGVLPADVTLSRENVWRLLFKLRSSSTFNL